MQARLYLLAQVLSDKVLLLQSAAYAPSATVRPQYRSKRVRNAPTSTKGVSRHACVRACMRAGVLLCVESCLCMSLVLSVLFYACMGSPVICVYACDSYVFVAIDMIGATVRSRKPRTDPIPQALNTPGCICRVPVGYP